MTKASLYPDGTPTKLIGLDDSDNVILTTSFAADKIAAEEAATTAGALAASYSDAVAVDPGYRDTTQIGISTTPANGTASTSATFMLQRPSSRSQYLSSILFYAKGTGSPITFQRVSRSGSTIAVQESWTYTPSSTGLKTLTPADFGSRLFAAGEYLTVQGTGLFSYNNTAPAGAGYFTITGGTNVGALTTATYIEMQVNFAAPNRVSTDDGETLLPLKSLKSTGVMGLSVSPVAGTTLTAGNAFQLQYPVGAGARYIEAIEVYAPAPGWFTLYRQSVVGSTATTIATYTIWAASIGLNRLTRRHFGEIPVNPGEWLAIDGGGSATYNAVATEGARYRPLTGSTVGSLNGTHHLEIKIEYAIVQAPGLRNAPTSAVAPLATDGRSLTGWRAKMAIYKRAGTGKGKIVLSGDSWAEYTAIPQQLANILYAKSAKAGEGWISVNATGGLTAPLNSSTFTKSGWTLYDASGGSAVPTGGCAPDGMCVYATGTSATAQIVATATDFALYYAQRDGTFRYRVDGGSWTAVVGTSTNGLGIVNISGLTNASHTIDIDLTGNAGTVLLHGFRAHNTAGAGVELLKMGNASATATSYGLFCDSYINPILTDVAPDIYAIILGTNDYRGANTSPDNLTSVLTRIKAALPATCAMIVVMPARTNGTAIYQLSDYRDATYAWALANGVEWLNLHDIFGTYAVEDAAGMYTDTLHFNSDGGYRAGAEFVSRLLQPGTNL